MAAIFVPSAAPGPGLGDLQVLQHLRHRRPLGQHPIRLAQLRTTCSGVCFRRFISSSSEPIRASWTINKNWHQIRGSRHSAPAPA
jgi:hypothetical protein